MAMTWDPNQYARFSDHRGRPFRDLTARIDADRPRRVVDLGCGPGNLTALLARRWPGAEVQGIDSSPEMIAAAHAAVPEVGFSVGDLRDWQPEPDVDVLVSNATLQWVPEHVRLIEGWADLLPSGAWMAFQVPGNFNAPSHAIMRELAESARWSARLAGVLRHDVVGDPGDYANLLLGHGWLVDAWETTYTQLLTGTDPVLEWVRGTGLRPILQALEPDEAATFEAEYADRLRVAYPAGPHGTMYPFRRIFVVGHHR